MHRRCAGWLSFRRIHLAALISDWRRTLLSVIGVALGVTVVLGTLLLKFELARPFDSFGPSLTHAAGSGVVEVTPNVSGRLPIEMVDRLRAELPDAEAVIPIVASLTPVEVAGSTHGFFLLGGSCQIELLVGSFNCEQRARDEKPADGPGVPLQIPAVIAERHGLAPGDELRIPGLPGGSAHLGWTFADFDRVEGINDGYVLLAPSWDVAADMLSTPGYATAAFVVPKPGADITADIDRVIVGVATAGPPRPHQPAIFENGSQSFNLIAFAGVLIGLLIAVNTILLAVEDRRAVMGTIGAIGAKPVGLFCGMLGEGAVVGVLGGLLGVPSGFLLGQYLVDTFGQSIADLDVLFDVEVRENPAQSRLTERIAAGGYPRAFIEATRLYVEKLHRLPDEPELGQQELQMFARRRPSPPAPSTTSPPMSPCTATTLRRCWNSRLSVTRGSGAGTPGAAYETRSTVHSLLSLPRGRSKPN